MALSTAVFAASLRDYVCVVRPKLSSGNEEFLKEFKGYLSDRGYKTYSKYIEGYLSGVFGSGFIYYASDGKPYILTNRHVLESAESVAVSFENEDESTSEFKDLKIVAMDENVDLAIIALPAGFKRKGLRLRENTVRDGDSVWSAGFPGLGSEPSWQLGNGIVSNNKAKIKELLDPSISPLIQHTAEVDGGNSGGPLLVKDSSEESGYYVVGINTWKAMYRQNTNFSIPSDLVKKTVEKNLSREVSEEFDQRVKKLCAALETEEKDFINLSRYISNDMVLNYGKKEFVNAVSVASEESQKLIVTTFAENPIEGLRVSLAYKVWSDFNSAGAKNISLGEREETGSSMKIQLKLESGKDVETVWCNENGNWKLKSTLLLTEIKKGNKISSASRPSKSNTPKDPDKKLTFTDPYAYTLDAAFVLPAETLAPGFEADFRFNFNFFGIGLFFLTQKTCADVKKDRDFSTYTYQDDNYPVSAFGGTVELKVPLNFERILVEPFLEGKTGFSNFSEILNKNGGFCGGFSVGSDVVFKAADGFGIGGGLKYQFMKYVNASSSMIEAYLVLRFGESW